MKKITLIATLCAAACALSAQQYFVGNCDKDALSYKCGEPMNFQIGLFEDGKPVVGQKLVWEINTDDGMSAKGEAVSAQQPLKLSTKCNRPGFARVKVFAVDKDGKKIKSQMAKNRPLSFQGGAGADVCKIATSGPEPKDFDAFWQKHLDELAKVPMNCKVKPLPKFSKDGKFNVSELTIDCVGKPAKAFLSVPVNAKEKSLPIHVTLIGYGVGRIAPKPRADAISLIVLRHSYETLQNDDYYKKMRDGELKAFGLKAKENQNPDNCYFKNMILRDLRALDYVKKNVKEWNGRDITVQGGSMGGFQSIFMAALDKDITLCLPHVPWMTDLWASDCNTTRQRCEFKPEWTPAIRYFDSTFAIKRVKCPVKITAWLGDYVCPPAGVMALYNNANKNTSIDFGQNGVHGGCMSKPETSKHFTLSK